MDEFIKGEIFERGQWHKDANDAEVAKRELIGLFMVIAHEEGVRFGNLEFEDLPADNERVPRPAEAGYMMVAWATVEDVGPPQVITGPSVLHDLDPSDLELLRKVTEQAYMLQYPAAEPLTPDEIDTIIDQAVPAAASNLVKRMVDAGAVH